MLLSIAIEPSVPVEDIPEDDLDIIGEHTIKVSGDVDVDDVLELQEAALTQVHEEFPMKLPEQFHIEIYHEGKMIHPA